MNDSLSGKHMSINLCTEKNKNNFKMQNLAKNLAKKEETSESSISRQRDYTCLMSMHGNTWSQTF